MRLAELLKESGISRTKLCQRAEMQPAQLNKYYYNSIARLDTDVLARLCTVLDCEIGDLLEFVPPEDAYGFCHCLSCEHIVSKSSLLFRQT